MKNTKRTTGWSTSAHGGPTEPSPTELSALKRQLDDCAESRGFLFGVRCAVDAMSRKVASHFMTSVLVIVLLAVGVGILVAKA